MYRRTRRLAWLTRRMTILVVAIPLAACSLTVDTDGLVGSSDGGAVPEGASHVDATAPSDATSSSDARSDGARADASSGADATTCSPLNGSCQSGPCCANLLCYARACVRCLPSCAPCTVDSDCCGGKCDPDHTCF